MGLKIVGENLKMSKSVWQFEVYGGGHDNITSCHSFTHIFTICYDTQSVCNINYNTVLWAKQNELNQYLL